MKTTNQHPRLGLFGRKPVESKTGQVGTKPIETGVEAKGVETKAAQISDGQSSVARAALKKLALDSKVEKRGNGGAKAGTLGARLMAKVTGREGAKNAMTALGLGVAMMGIVQPAMADVVVVEQGSSRHLQDAGRQLAGETGEGFVQVKANEASLRKTLDRTEKGQGDLDHLILEVGSEGVDLEMLQKLKADFPQSFEGVTNVHVIGENLGADPFQGKGADLFPNAQGIVGFSIDQGASGAGPASAWLVQETGRSLYEMPYEGLSPQAALIKAKSIANQASRVGVNATVSVSGQTAQQAAQEKPDLVLTYSDAQAQNSSEIMFRVPSDMRNVKDGQSVLIPLEAGRTMHMVELKYQDTRKLKDLEFNRRAPGGEWETFRGDEYHSSVQQEKAGELQIKRESDHNSAWINNPIRVKVEVVDGEGNVIQSVGKKFLDFHVHDAHSPDSSGYPETDNINNTYENLPKDKLPEGSYLRLTPVHENRKAWEADREVAMDLSWVKPIYMPEHTERASVRQGGWEKPNPAGYDVEAGRPIAGVFVKWTDHGGSSSGSVKITQPDGQTFRSQRYNVGSGETELIPLDGVVSKDGKLHIEGFGLEVGDIEVLYQ